MNKKLRLLTAGVAFTAATLALTASPASAQHCTQSGQPGSSEFADHVQLATHSEGGTHRGWSTCVPQTPHHTG